MNCNDACYYDEHQYCDKCGDCLSCEARIGYEHYCDDCGWCRWDCRCE